MTETGRAKAYDPTAGRTGGVEQMLAELYAAAYTAAYEATTITIGARSGSYNPQEGL